MPVDPKKKRIVLIVHGVQTGTDADMDQDKIITELINARLKVPVPFETVMYKYENINDQAQARLRTVIGLFTDALKVKKIVDIAQDVVFDVLINMKNGETAQTIRKGLKDKILEYYHQGNPLYIVSHSLGTVYTFETINEMMGDKKLFKPKDRKTWPVQALMTLGSPLGLKMFKRNKIRKLGAGNKFRWVNFLCRTDPVVTGSVCGRPLKGYDLLKKLFKKSTNWEITDRTVDTGSVWLIAHTGYWNQPGIGDDLVKLISS